MEMRINNWPPNTNRGEGIGMVYIITDTTACFPTDVQQQYNIPVVPQIINFGNESLQEGVDIDIKTFLGRLQQSKEIPKTSAPPPELFVEIFQNLVPTQKPIICIAAADFPDADLRIIDTRTVASPLGVLVTLAAEMAAAGKDADDICRMIDGMIPKSRIFFIVETLDYLVKGGRIGGASALIGTLLQIKPILIFKDGKVDQFDRERTHKRAVSRLLQLVLDQIETEGNGYPSVLHADNYEEAKLLAAEIAEKMGIAAVPIFDMPPAIVTHVGPKTLAVGFFTA
jgi:DegV family protein with EDD domain